MTDYNSPRGLFRLSAMLLIAVAGAAARVAAEPIVALTVTNQLITFDSATPAIVGPIVPVTGLAAGETLLAIDFRPADGRLYALAKNFGSNIAQLYVVDTTTGAATPVGAPFGPLSGSDWGFDVNPMVDLIRVTSNADHNLRLDPNGGPPIGDSQLAYAAGDPNVGIDPFVVGSAYTNNFVGAQSTSLYGIDSFLDILVNQSNPSANNGLLTTVGPLGFNTSPEVGFDISGASGIAYASLTPEVGLASVSPSWVPAVGSFLYTIDLGTGAATLVGLINSGAIRAISVVPQEVEEVPEPSTIALLSTGIAGLLHVRRRRRIAAARRA